MSSNGTEYHDPAVSAQSQVGLVIGVVVTFTAVSALVVALRLYVRTALLKTAGADDWTMLVAQILAIVTCVATVREANTGIGRHVWTVPAEDTMVQLKFLYVVIIVYNLGMNVVKISFLLQYRRIFQSEWVQRLCTWGIAYVVVWVVVQELLLATSCLPLSYIVPGTSGWCLNTLPIWFFSSAMSLATDFIIFLIPLPSVFKLQLPRKQKILVFGIFCLGFFVCIISIIRMLTLREAVYSSDPTWDNTGAALWSPLELTCSILCSSLPTLRPLLARIIPGLGSSFKSRAGYQNYGSTRTDGVNATRRRGPGGIDSKSLDQGSGGSSTEQLALDTIGRRDGHTGVYAVCVADVRSEEDSLELGQEREPRRQNGIMVTTETSIGGHEMGKS